MCKKTRRADMSKMYQMDKRVVCWNCGEVTDEGSCPVCDENV